MHDQELVGVSGLVILELCVGRTAKLPVEVRDKLESLHLGELCGSAEAEPRLCITNLLV